MLCKKLACMALALTASAGLIGTEEIRKLPPPSLMDGELSEDSWKRASKAENFTEITGKTVSEQTEVRFFVADDSIFVGFRCHFLNREKKETEIANAKSVYSTDVAEIFLDPGSTGNYAHIGINGAGMIQTDGIDGSLEYGVQLHQNDWTVEIRIPFHAIRLAGGTFLKDWKINFARGNTKIREFSSWAELSGGSFHDQANFKNVSGIEVDLENLYRAQQQEKKGVFAIAFPRLIYDVQTELPVQLDLKWEKSMKGFSLACRMEDSAKKEVLSKVVKPVFFRNEFRLPLEGLQNGKHVLTLSLLDASGKEVLSGKKTFWKIPPRTGNASSKYEIRDHSLFDGNGQFSFPIAIWGWSLPYRDGFGMNAEAYLAAQDAVSEDIRSHGFNAVINSRQDISDEPYDDLVRYGTLPDYNRKTVQSLAAMGISFRTKLERLSKKGLNMIAFLPYISVNNPREEHISRWVDMMLKYREYDNILCWFTSDEADGAVESNLLRRQLCREMAPERPVLLNVINAVAQNRDAADIISTDPYPIPHGNVTLVTVHMQRLLMNLKKNQSPWLWLQLFGGEGSWTRPPAPEEVRVMAFLAMNHGVRGILYFIYQPPEMRNGVRQNPETWESLKILHPQITELAPVYCLGKMILRETRGGIDIFIGEYNGKTLVSCVNTLKEKVVFSTGLPLSHTGKVSVKYENRKIDMKNGSFSDVFQPYEVHLYEF